MKDIFSIEKKVIVITGATGHLGSKMVEDLSKAKAKVIVLSRNLQKAKELCEKYSLSENQAFEIDITKKVSVEKVFKLIVEKFGKIDVLVNNAAFSSLQTFENYEDSDWHESHEGTVITTDTTTKVAIKYMRKEKKGRVINISSMYGMVSPNKEMYENEALINPIGYGVGKAGIIQYTKYCAMMLAKDGITVNSISYGPFPNPKTVTNEVFLKKLANNTMLKRVGNSKEVVSAVYFLSLDENSYMTGQNIVVDGGWTSW